MNKAHLSSFSPVAIFACRRPGHLASLLSSIQKNFFFDDTPFFIFIGRPQNDADWPLVNKSVETARKFKAPAGVQVIELFSESTGSGLIRSGVDLVLKQYEQIVVLEDDLEVRQDFLLYMNSALQHFSLNSDVYSVSAWNFGIIEPSAPNRTYLFPCTTSWGWATWKRAWLSSLNTPSDYSWLVEKSERIHRFNFHENYNCLRMIERIMEEDYDAWDAAWYLHCFRGSKLSVFPNSSLVINRGFDGSGLNFRKSYAWQSNFREAPQEMFVFPVEMNTSKEFKKYTQFIKKWSQSFWPDSNLKFFVDQLKRKRRQHLNYYKRGFYSLFNSKI